MTTWHDDMLSRVLRQALPPIDAAPPGDDLWPRVEHGLPRPRAAVSLLEWLLIAAAAAWCLARPDTIRLLLFHF